MSTRFEESVERTIAKKLYVALSCASLERLSSPGGETRKMDLCAVPRRVKHLSNPEWVEQPRASCSTHTIQRSQRGVLAHDNVEPREQVLDFVHDVERLELGRLVRVNLKRFLGIDNQPRQVDRYGRLSLAARKRTESRVGKHAPVLE